MDVMRSVQLSRVGWAVPILGLFLWCASAAAAPTDLFERYGDGGMDFEEIEIGDMQVYFHQRTISEATVEKDYIVYQFDKDTGELLARKCRWREDLSDRLPAIAIGAEEAAAAVGGQVQTARLYIISPESEETRLVTCMLTELNRLKGCLPE